MSTTMIERKASARKKPQRHDLGTIPMGILEALLRSSRPLAAEDLIARLRRDGNEATGSAVYRALNKLKGDGRIRYANATKESAEAALRNAQAIADTLDDDNAPDIKSVTRYEITDLGRAHFAGRAGITEINKQKGISRTRWLLKIFEGAMANLVSRDR
jgi:DNA-binding PadR family transcriptional regulator